MTVIEELDNANRIKASLSLKIFLIAFEDYSYIKMMISVVVAGVLLGLTGQAFSNNSGRTDDPNRIVGDFGLEFHQNDMVNHRAIPLRFEIELIFANMYTIKSLFTRELKSA